MRRAPWTYEVPAAGADSVALEEYVVEEASGDPVGKVMTVLERRGELYVAVERGTPPLTHDLRAVPWKDVERVDHSSLTVRLGLPKEGIEEALQLDPKKRVEGERAEAHRLTELPRALRPSTTPEAAGPVDRPLYMVALGSFALSLLALLALFIAASRVDFTWHFAFLAIPALLFLVSLVSGYRLFRRPYEGVRERER
jgi:hypothetical protein